MLVKFLNITFTLKSSAEISFIFSAGKRNLTILKNKNIFRAELFLSDENCYEKYLKNQQFVLW